MVELHLAVRRAGRRARALAGGLRARDRREARRRATTTRRSRSTRRVHPEPRATLADVADHIEHVRDVAGIDHVGIGADFFGEPHVDGGGARGRRRATRSCSPSSSAAAGPRRCSSKLARGNVLRALRGAEQAAARLQKARPASIPDDRTARPRPGAAGQVLKRQPAAASSCPARTGTACGRRPAPWPAGARRPPRRRARRARRGRRPGYSAANSSSASGPSFTSRSRQRSARRKRAASRRAASLAASSAARIGLEVDAAHQLGDELPLAHERAADW